MSGYYCGQSGSQFCDCCSFYEECHKYDRDSNKKEQNIIKSTPEMYDEYIKNQEKLRKQLNKFVRNE